MQKGALNIAITEATVRRGIRRAVADREEPARQLVTGILAVWLAQHGYLPADSGSGNASTVREARLPAEAGTR